MHQLAGFAAVHLVTPCSQIANPGIMSWISWDLRSVQRIAELKDTARAKGAEWPYTGFNGIIGST